MVMVILIFELKMGFEKFELEWSADDRKWSDVVKMINTGTSKVASVISR